MVVKEDENEKGERKEKGWRIVFFLGKDQTDSEVRMLGSVDPFEVCWKVVQSIAGSVTHEQSSISPEIEVVFASDILFGPRTLLFGFDCHNELRGFTSFLLPAPIKRELLKRGKFLDELFSEDEDEENDERECGASPRGLPSECYS
eukprot:CAMPEP_0201513848 /NCGR_PEP_ID=MMETSP0161_2-20130828/5821_1 /ASSEMBLY_ACC=CAM_ASM_000251 /TAXON_ID=180227 /ORGANISM="Neoparamoeba aestuarina, Strain SoJaBio B1-5/56/2" /LENGTH=145 /DNA_ID=CAMNT_0047910221 /DNA_START=1246 /DNA_END=1683 /DNA_ORIENTATION=-